MKKVILLIFLFIPVIVFSQSGGKRSLKIKSENIIHTDFENTSDTILIYLVNGVEKQLYLDPATIYIENDTLKSYGTGGTGWNYETQTLYGTTPSLDVSFGLNAKITLTGNTTITLSNLEDGMDGTIRVLCASSAYIITFSGYTFKIGQAVYNATAKVYSSGALKEDSFSWKYIDGIVQINGSLGYR